MKKEEFKFFVGIDVSKATLDLALIKSESLNEFEKLQVENKPKGLKEIGNWLKKHQIEINQVLFCMEFTGVYNRPVQRYLDKLGAFLWVEMPVRILRSIGLQRGKSDAVDAKRIAQYAARHQQDRIRWVMVGKTQDNLKDLIRLRNRLITAKNKLLVPVNELKETGEKARSRNVNTFCAQSLKSLDRDIEKVEEEIRQLIKNEPSMEKNFQLMLSIPGVGTWTALQMVCATDNFKRLNQAKQLACFCGCAPFEHRSGTSVRGKTRVSHMADTNLKTLLTLGARSIINSKNEMSYYYHRKVAEGKNKMSVINALRNKIIHRIIAVIERQSPYLKTDT
jgi:transposase